MTAMTYELAIAAAQDAGNQHMRRKDLQKWDQGCWDRATETLHDIYGHEAAIAKDGICPECQS